MFKARNIRVCVCVLCLHNKNEMKWNDHTEEKKNTRNELCFGATKMHTRMNKSGMGCKWASAAWPVEASWVQTCFRRRFARTKRVCLLYFFVSQTFTRSLFLFTQFGLGWARVLIVYESYIRCCCSTHLTNVLAYFRFFNSLMAYIYDTFGGTVK